jgi:hypothetical protein
MPIVSLSNGQTVTIKDAWTHKCEKAFNMKLYPDEQPLTVERIYQSFEAVFPLLIEKIEKDGGSLPYSLEWLEGLNEMDYRMVRDAVDALSKDGQGAGKKNP